MRLILDASAAMELAGGRPIAGLQDAAEVLVPDLFVAEVSNAIWQQHKFAGMDAEFCDTILEQILNIPDTLVPSLELRREAFFLARTLSHPVYDMFYLALAQRESAGLVTKDKVLRKFARGQGVPLL